MRIYHGPEDCFCASKGFGQCVTALKTNEATSRIEWFPYAGQPFKLATAETTSFAALHFRTVVCPRWYTVGVYLFGCWVNSPWMGINTVGGETEASNHKRPFRELGASICVPHKVGTPIKMF